MVFNHKIMQKDLFAQLIKGFNIFIDRKQKNQFHGGEFPDIVDMKLLSLITSKY